jgi:hypothetical protein
MHFRDKIVIFRPKVLQNKFEPNTVVYSKGDSLSDVTDFVKQN